MPPCLTLSIIRYGSRVKWRNPWKGVASSPTPWCSSYRKRCLRVTLDYGRQLLYKYIYISVVKIRRILPKSLEKISTRHSCITDRLFYVTEDSQHEPLNLPLYGNLFLLERVSTRWSGFSSRVWRGNSMFAHFRLFFSALPIYVTLIIWPAWNFRLSTYRWLAHISEYGHPRNIYLTKTSARAGCDTRSIFLVRFNRFDFRVRRLKSLLYLTIYP